MTSRREFLKANRELLDKDMRRAGVSCSINDVDRWDWVQNDVL